MTLLESDRFANGPAHDAQGGAGVSIEFARRLVDEDRAVLIDVRTLQERETRSFIPDSLHVAWRLGAAQMRNPRFLRELSRCVAPGELTLFICETAQRSSEAADAAVKAGFRAAYVLEGVAAWDRPHGLRLV